MLCKKTSKNQLTLPKAIVKFFPDTDYYEVVEVKHDVCGLCKSSSALK